jgi:Ca2+-binding EF-hand superfamily protein
VDLKKLGIDENMFEELQALFKMFDLDSDGVLSLAEFEKVLSLLGHSGI